MYKLNRVNDRAVQLCCIPIVHFPSIMHPVRTPSFGSRSRSRSAICVVCVKVFLHTAHQWDPNLDMCHLCRKLCAIVQAEEVSKVHKLGGKNVQHRFDDYARRYLVSRRQSSIYVITIYEVDSLAIFNLYNIIIICTRTRMAQRAPPLPAVLNMSGIYLDQCGD
jgi:hypothetical protein